jgi:hypothetical protein
MRFTNTRRFFQYVRMFAIFSAPYLCFSQVKVNIVFVTGGPGKVEGDRRLEADLHVVTAKLNRGAQGIVSYQLHKVDFIFRAEEMAAANQDESWILIAHGVNNTDNLGDWSNESTPKSEVVGFRDIYHCDADGSYNAEYFGGKIADTYCHSYGDTYTVDALNGYAIFRFNKTAFGPSGYYTVTIHSYERWYQRFDGAMVLEVGESYSFSFTPTNGPDQWDHNSAT